MTFSLVQTLARKLATLALSKEDTLLLAISGGRDSVALGQALYRLGQSFALAHVNYQLRGADSKADEDFVQALAVQWGVVCHVKQVSDQEWEGNLQQKAREIRYGWFEQLCDEHGYTAYLTAHHQRDQAESLLLALFKGRGSRALAGMPLQLGRRVRPLLGVSEEAVQQFAQNEALVWRQDASNQSLKYDRNFIRNEVLPLLRSRFPQLDVLLSREADRLQAQESILESWIQERKSVWIEEVDPQYHRWQLHAVGQEPYFNWVLGRLATDYGWSQSAIDSLQQLWEAQVGKKMEAAGWTVVRTRTGFDWFVMPPKKPFHVMITSPGCWKLPDTSQLEAVHRIGKDVAGDFCIPAQLLQQKWALRHWQAGDKIEIEGVGHKKVSDILQESGWNYRQRALAVVLTLNDEAVWLVGGRSRTFAGEQLSEQNWLVFTLKHDA